MPAASQPSAAPVSIHNNGFSDDDPFGSLPSQPPPASASTANPFASTPPPTNSGGSFHQQPYRPPPSTSAVRAKRSVSQGGWEPWLLENPKTLKLAAIIAAASFVLSAIPFLGIVVFGLVALSYVAIQTAGGIWLVVVAFQEDVTQGLLYLLVPFYALYYLVTRWDRSRLPFMLCMMSVLSFVCSLGGFFVGLIIYGTLMGNA